MQNHQCCQCLWPLRVWGISVTVRVLCIQGHSLRMKPGKVMPSKHAGAMHMLVDGPSCSVAAACAIVNCTAGGHCFDMLMISMVGHDTG